MNFDPFLGKTSAAETALNQPGLRGELDGPGGDGLGLVGLQTLSSSPYTSCLVGLPPSDLSWGISVLVFLLSVRLSFIGHLGSFLGLEERLAIRGLDQGK